MESIGILKFVNLIPWEIIVTYELMHEDKEAYNNNGMESTRNLRELSVSQIPGKTTGFS